MQKINENLISSFTWSSFSEISLDDKCLYDSNFRILHLKECPDLSDFKKILCENDCVKNVLAKSEYLFCLIVHVDVETVNKSILDELNTVINDVFFESVKHFLVEFYSNSFDDNIRFIFNYGKVTQFNNVKNSDKSGYGDSAAGEENDEIWANVFDKPLLKFGLEAGKYETYIKDATEKGDGLFLRILKSFSIPIKLSLEKELLEKLMSKNHEAVKAYLDLPIVEVSNENSISPNALTKKIINFNYTLKRKSLLCIAVEEAELDVVNLLLRLGFDINQATEDGKTATDYCQNSEILKFLLNNDAKFPIDFSKKFESFRNCFGSKRDIYDIAVDRKNLHAAIRSENKVEILAFRKKYPNLRMAYIYMDAVPYNQSATMQSLKKALCLEPGVETDHSQSNFELYAFLFSNGFRDDYTEIVDLKMPIGLQEDISRTLLNNFKYSQPAHMGYLRNKTKIGTVVGLNADGYQVVVDKVYKHINDIGSEEVHNILKVLEHSQFLTIVIDFHSKYVNPMCPLLNKETDGITFQNDGNIYIGARDKSHIEIAATLVHELSHLAIHIAFDNACKPYYANDTKNEQKMLDIVDQIHQIQKACGNDVIKSVFRYKKSLWPRELIVRVPELIVLKKRSLFDDENYKNLFNFFKNHVLSIVENMIREPEDFRLRRDVEQLNCYLGHVEQIKSFKDRGIWPKNSRMLNAQSIVCSTPNLLLADIFINVIEPSLICSLPINEKIKKKYFIVASVDDFQLLLKKRRILRTWKAARGVTLILNCENFNEMFLQQQSLFFEELNKKRKIILFASNEKSLLSISPNLKPKIVQYSWTDIDRKYIEILFQREICFQSANVALNTLIDTDCNVITLEKLINDRPIKVETFKVSIDNYDAFQYIERRFTTYRNVDNLLTQVSNKKKTLLLSGVSGCGKSIIFSRICLKIKENHRHFWVSRINLHEWGETFVSIGTSDPMTFLTNILVQTDDLTDRQFQQELFKKLYRNSKVILLFDAYDELNLKYRQAFKLFIQQLGQKIQIWISTRPQFVKGLETLFDENYVPLQLEKFTYDEIYNCATKFWQNYLNLPNDREVELKLNKCARVMIHQFIDSVKAFLLSAFFMQPSTTVILAEYYQQHVKELIFSDSETFTIEYIDIFDVYKMIIFKKVMILYKQKGYGIAAETAEDFLYQDVVAYLEHLSLLSRFGSSVVNSFDNFVNIKYDYFDVVEQTNEFLNGLLQRSGLISISDSGDPHIYFLDDSVSDYFIANFVIRKLKRITYLERSINQPDFDTAMKVLCINVIHPIQDHLTLITFIDEGLKRFWDDLSESVIDVLNIYFNRTPEITFEFDLNTNFLEYLLDKNAIFLLTFFMQCFITMESSKFDEFDEFDEFDTLGKSKESSKFDIDQSKRLFGIASGRGIFCIVDLFCKEKVLKELVFSNHLYVNAFRQAFLYFPENKVAAVKDNETFYRVKNALTKSNEFDKILRELVEGEFKTSTLCVLTNICKEAISPLSPLSQEQLKPLIMFEACEFNYDYYVCNDFFDKYVEMKWFALKELGYRASTWKDVTDTLFGTVVAKIFFKFDNILVLKFYNWAYSKKNLKNSFKDFVEDTIVRYFHRCSSTSGVDKIFRFIRQEVGIDIISVYSHRNLSEYHDEYQQFLPICKQHFTKDEFTAFLTCRDADEDENYFEYILKNRTCELGDVLLIFHHFQMDDVEIMSTVQKSCNIALPYVKEMLHTINKSILLILNERCVTGRGKLKSSQIISSIENVFSDLLKEAFQSPQMYGRTIFQSACLYEDIYVLNEIWQIAKRIGLTDDELKNSLSLKDARIRKAIIRDGESRFSEIPPTIYNTYCESAAYQFIPFNQNNEIPKYAIRFDVDANRSTFIGRLNGDYDQLCQIIFSGTELPEIKSIPYDARIERNDYANLDNEIEILTGKGVEWSVEIEGQKFKYNNLHLWANEHGHISLQGTRRYDEYILIYNSLFKDISDETIIYYKNDYRNQLQK